MASRSFLQLTSLLLLCLSQFARSETVLYDLNIANADIGPDGFTRSTVLANGQYPAPLLSANAGDSFSVNVTDSLTDTSMHRSTSIHWHGMFQATTNNMDGVPWVNQCPIIPGDSFSYNFNCGGQTGTYFYHSHVSTQYCDGLRGPLVIYDPEDPHAGLYDVDDESTVITLSDWYHEPSTALLGPASGNTANSDPTPKSTLINGKGRYSEDPTTDLHVVKVTKGQRYRFRIINMSCYPSYTFQIDGHNMTVIEADGIETEPVEVESLVLFASQRYSVVVEANQDVGNFWIRANPNVGTTGFANGINSAILRYDGAAEEEPTTIQDINALVLNEADLHPIVDPAAPGEPFAGGVDYAVNLALGLNFTDGTHTINGVKWSNPKTPVLLQVLSGASSANDLLPAGSVYPLPLNSTIEISIPGGFPHPMHLHGHAFSIVRAAGQTDYNYVNPPRRDVLSVGSRTDNVTIRFVTDNSGPWFFHCHIDWHLQTGLAVVFVEGSSDDITQENPVDSDWEQLCPDYAENNPDEIFGE